MNEMTPEPPTTPPLAPQTPPPTHRIVPQVHPPPPPIEFWKGFLDLTGGSLFYCLSALSIIYGITQIMGPLLLKTGVLSETLPCIGALNLYELALLGTLVFIVVWQKVTDDAISLVVLIPLFLVGSGIALDTVANNGPVLAIGIGILCTALGGGKLIALKQSIRLPFGQRALVGLSLVITWNFLAGPLMGKLFADHPSLVASNRLFWLSSLLLLLIAGTLVLVEMMQSPEPSPSANTPFLHSAHMVSVFVMVLLGAAGAHLYALGYQFDIRFSGGDFMLLGTLGVLLLLETMHRFDKRLQQAIAILGCTPLLGTAIMLGNNDFSAAPFQWNLELLGHPCTVMLVAGLGMMRLAKRTGFVPYWGISAVYGLAVVLTAFSPATPTEFNWRLCYGLLVSALLLSGVLLKRAPLCLAAIFMSAIGLSASVRFEHAAAAIGLTVSGGVAGVFGLGILTTILAFKDKKLIPLAIIGAAALVGSSFDFVTNTIGWRDLIMLCVLGSLGSLIWWRLRTLFTVIILAVPVAERLWLLFRTLSTWRYVVLSFVLLGFGAWLSTIKSRRNSGNRPAG